MKKKIITLFLVGVLGISLTACGKEEIQSVLDDANAEEILSTIADLMPGSGEEAEDEDYEIEIPDSIVNISPEDDKALTGVLTEDSYTNEYFGLKVNRFENGTIESLLDDGTDLMTLSEAYANGFGIIYINSRTPDSEYTLSLSISAVLSGQQGKTEKDLAQERYDTEQGINEAMEYESECSVENITIAGTEHPAFIEVAEDEEGGTAIKTASASILKGDFLCGVSVKAPVDKFDEVLKYIEKI